MKDYKTSADVPLATEAEAEAEAEAQPHPNVSRPLPPLTDQQIEQAASIRAAGKALHEAIARCGNSREISLAITKADEAVMWATKHVTT